MVNSLAFGRDEIIHESGQSGRSVADVFAHGPDGEDKRQSRHFPPLFGEVVNLQVEAPGRGLQPHRRVADDQRGVGRIEQVPDFYQWPHWAFGAFWQKTVSPQEKYLDQRLRSS